jgi:hypothetical protein
LFVVSSPNTQLLHYKVEQGALGKYTLAWEKQEFMLGCLAFSSITRVWTISIHLEFSQVLAFDHYSFMLDYTASKVS